MELLKSITIRERWFLHNWVIMPNHIHLLVEIVSSSAETHNAETHNAETRCSASLAKLSRKPNSISSFVAIFKSVTTKRINALMDNNDAQPRDAERRDALQCSSTIWQSNYHDHIVRNYNSFNTIYQYIKNNPKN